jgi:hypothetical protein
MKRATLTLAVLALVLGGTGPANAGTINLATGFDSSNNLIGTGGVTDAHWTVDPGPTSPLGLTQTVFPNNADWYGGWLGNGPNSDWIARNANVTDNGPATYTFYRTFNLSGYDLSTVSLSGAWAIDDGGHLNLNGTQLGAELNPGNWTALNPFSVATGSPLFNQGLNTLSITLDQSDQFLEGVRLEGLVTGTQVTIPEPTTLTMVGVTVAGLAGYRLRRRKVAVMG